MTQVNHSPSTLPPSLWAATATSAPDTPPLDGDGRADVAVVGAGFTGLSAALHLADRAIILDMGQVVFDGKAQEVLENADLRQQYLAI